MVDDSFAVMRDRMFNELLEYGLTEGSTMLDVSEALEDMGYVVDGDLTIAEALPQLVGMLDALADEEPRDPWDEGESWESEGSRYLAMK